MVYEKVTEFAGPNAGTLMTAPGIERYIKRSAGKSDGSAEINVNGYVLTG